MPRRTRLVLGPIVVAVMAYLCYFYISAPQFHRVSRDLEEARIAFALTFLGTVIYTAVRAMFTDEVWEVSTDRLVIRTTFFWKKWQQQYTGATLLLETYNNVHGGRSTSLVVRATEGRHTLQTVRRNRLLGNGSIRDLGAYFSQVTGWPLRDDSQDWP